MNDLNEFWKRIQEIYDNLKSYNVDAMMLLNRQGEKKFYYPEGDDLFLSIGQLITATISDYDYDLDEENKTQGFEQIPGVELLGEEKTAFALKISDDSDYVLCIVSSKNNPKLGMMKTKLANTVKQKIVTAMTQEGLIGGE